MMTFILCFMIDWNQVFLRDPIANTKAKVVPAPVSACFCTDCNPCTCRDGKHSASCSVNKKGVPVKPIETPVVNPVNTEPVVIPPVVQQQYYRFSGGSGTVYQHENYEFLVNWIAANDPVHYPRATQTGSPTYRTVTQGVYSTCAPGTACYRGN